MTVVAISLLARPGWPPTRHGWTPLLPPLFAVLALSSLAVKGKWPIQPFGATRRRLAFVIIALGVCTLFLRLATISPPTWGRSEWSVFGIFSEIRTGNLPFDARMAYFAETYVLLLIALIFLFFPSVHKLLALVAGLGTISSNWAFYRGDLTLLETFYSYREWSQGVGTIMYGPALYILAIAMPALLLICINEDLDPPKEKADAGPTDRAALSL